MPGSEQLFRFTLFIIQPYLKSSNQLLSCTANFLLLSSLTYLPLPVFLSSISPSCDLSHSIPFPHTCSQCSIHIHIRCSSYCHSINQIPVLIPGIPSHVFYTPPRTEGAYLVDLTPVFFLLSFSVQLPLLYLCTLSGCRFNLTHDVIA
jgi:hypothetical protein